MAAVAEFKRPESVLVVVHTPALDCLLLERVEPRGFWQSVTGSLRCGRDAGRVRGARARRRRRVSRRTVCATRDVQRSFPILPAWRSRYAPDVDSNIEHLWYLEVPEVRAVRHRADASTSRTSGCRSTRRSRRSRRGRIARRCSSLKDSRRA